MIGKATIAPTWLAAVSRTSLVPEVVFLSVFRVTRPVMSSIMQRLSVAGCLRQLMFGNHDVARCDFAWR